MMLDVSGLMSSPGDGAAPEGGGASGGSSEVGAASSSIPVENGERSGGGGNRWPRQETLFLLKIRSEMDVAFRDSSLKGPLWEEVSRKLLELGFQRSAKKCKEKFENVYKYHKRTKDGRATKPDGKTYRFFDQLQALESSPPSPPFTPQQPRPPMQMNAANFSMTSHVTVPSISPKPLTILPPNTTNMQSSMNINVPFQLPLINTANLPQTQRFQSSNPHVIFSESLPSNSSSSSTSTSSDEDIQRRRGRKRKWKDFFEKLTKDVVQKQEELQKKFLDTLEKRERDRTAREEAWRVEETARMNREHDLLVQERSIAAAKDAAVIAFLQKVTEQPSLQIPITSTTMNKSKTPEINIPPPVVLPPQPPPPPPLTQASKVLNTAGDGFVFSTSSSRWPKAEIEALIKLRTNLDLKYQENGPKGPLWEEISASMGKIGYNRSSKRCKEKWENINKYYKKVKESSKIRPEDSKTCPYFNQLEALYKEKSKKEIPIMPQSEQQWPFAEQRQPTMHDQDQDSDINEDGEDEEEEDVGGYEIVTNKQANAVEQ